MNRRDSLLTLLALGVASASRAQETAKHYRIGWLSYNTPESSKHLENALRQGLRDLGYIEGKNTVFEFRWAQGKPENAATLAKELVALKPDVVFAGSILTARALLSVTTVIPVVGTLIIDPVGNGFAKSLAKPAGNFTGRASLYESISGKQVELLLQMLPKRSHIGVLWNASNLGHPAIVKDVDTGAKFMGASILAIGVRNPDEIEQALDRMAREGIVGFIGLQDALFLLHRERMAELALHHKLASVYASSDHARAGALFSYGVSFSDEYRRGAAYIDKILRGAKPGDLPIEQAMIFEMVINMKTAKAIGIKIPLPVQLIATEVIE